MWVAWGRCFLDETGYCRKCIIWSSLAHTPQWIELTRLTPATSTKHPDPVSSVNHGETWSSIWLFFAGLGTDRSAGGVWTLLASLSCFTIVLWGVWEIPWHCSCLYFDVIRDVHIQGCLTKITTYSSMLVHGSI